MQTQTALTSREPGLILIPWSLTPTYSLLHFLVLLPCPKVYFILFFWRNEMRTGISVSSKIAE